MNHHNGSPGKTGPDIGPPRATSDSLISSCPPNTIASNSNSGSPSINEVKTRTFTGKVNTSTSSGNSNLTKTAISFDDAKNLPEKPKQVLKKALKKIGGTKRKNWEQRDKGIVQLRYEKDKLEAKRLPLTDKRDQLLFKLKEVETELSKFDSAIAEKDNELRKLLVEREAQTNTLSGSAESRVESIFEDSVTITLPKNIRLDDQLSNEKIFLCSEVLPGIDLDIFDIERENAREVSKSKVCARSFSTYPKRENDTKSGLQMGDPICDQYTVEFRVDRALLCVADGCGWGKKSREAARRAANCFTKMLSNEVEKTKNLPELGRLLTKCICSAHNAISLKKDDILEVGTTTLLGGIVAPITTTSSNIGLRRLQSGMNIHTAVAPLSKERESEELFAFIFVSIGDCKAFRYSCTSSKVTDLTPNNRENLDASDCGGRIGPYLQGGMPDVRNLALCCYPCNAGDLIMITSDGVHDNFDPHLLGHSPSHLSPDFAGLNWDQAFLKDPIKLSNLRTQFMCKKLQDIIASANEKPKAEIDTSTLKTRTEFNVSRVCTKISEYCTKITEATRKFYSQNDGRLPDDYKKYPGKVDHTTCVVYKV